MNRREIRSVRRDMRRLARATLNIGRIIQVIQFNELIDIGQSILFQFLIVLFTTSSSLSSDNTSFSVSIGTFMANWCIFLNLGSLMLDTDRKLRHPIGNILHKIMEKYSIFFSFLSSQINRFNNNNNNNNSSNNIIHNSSSSSSISLIRQHKLLLVITRLVTAIHRHSMLFHRRYRL